MVNDNRFRAVSIDAIEAYPKSPPDMKSLSLDECNDDQPYHAATGFKLLPEEMETVSMRHQEVHKCEGHEITHHDQNLMSETTPSSKLSIPLLLMHLHI